MWSGKRRAHQDIATEKFGAHAMHSHCRTVPVAGGDSPKDPPTPGTQIELAVTPPPKKAPPIHPEGAVTYGLIRTGIT